MKTIGLILLSVALGVLFLSLAAEAFARREVTAEAEVKETTRLSLTFERKVVSADIKGIPLRTVLNEIKERRGVWYDTGSLKDPSILNETISVHFEELPLQEGLQRILLGVNHVILFQGRSIDGVMLFGKPGKKRTFRGRRRIPRPRRTAHGRASRRASRRR